MKMQKRQFDLESRETETVREVRHVNITRTDARERRELCLRAIFALRLRSFNSIVHVQWSICLSCQRTFVITH